MSLNQTVRRKMSDIYVEASNLVEYENGNLLVDLQYFE
jgi:hypothetical protein